MLETMLALRNNDLRKIPGYDPEPVEKLRKLQRALVRPFGGGLEGSGPVSEAPRPGSMSSGSWRAASHFCGETSDWSVPRVPST